MTLPISSAGSNRPIVQEIGPMESVSRQHTQINHINSTDALKKAEMTGLKISVGDEQMVRRIDRALKALQGPNTTCEMSVHEQTNVVMIKVINKDTGDLIREIPPEKTLDIVAKLLEVNGLLIDERV
ncbi:flagellar biosynthesis protein FlaG [Paenibacillus sp. 1011MAR3C5]|uniref:flagellar protein FlaG n=1 Tax=Paenibacillus sp. 1011MAR3C5 TaxID=1675787 RepID=UPI000E6CCB5C|nr:flagellar protein FlaG [Paenibacillus sp. 1011MAR3C5]RJE85638.1 flagellar biosynthesis protein FlaG [Paenibacillus sp. 1011MAR3C5]